MKKYLLSMIMAVFVFIAMLPVETSAAEPAIKVTDQDGGTASVKLTLPNAALEEISTLSLSLMFELTDEAPDAQDLVSGVEFSGQVRQNAKVSTFRSHQGKMLNIYIAGTSPLFAAGSGGDTLEVGNVYVKNAAGENLPFQVDIEKSELSVVRGRSTEKIDVNDPDGSSGGSGEGSGGDPGDPENPGDPEGPSQEEPSEFQTVRENLKALLEKANQIPKGSRTSALQAAIDKAESVLADPNASLEELKAALMDPENELAIYESNQNSGNQTTDSGRDQARQNQIQSGNRAPAARTDDTAPIVPYAVMFLASMAVFGGIGRYRTRKG